MNHSDPLFYVFLPEYLESRGAETGESSPYYTWRNYMITNTVGIFGPVAAGFMCNWKVLGRKYTMVAGALLSMAFFFAYTAVRTATQNLAFTCVIYFTVNIYYGTLYAYTPEVCPHSFMISCRNYTLVVHSPRLGPFAHRSPYYLKKSHSPISFKTI